jgi:hypothetical protein
MMQTQENGGENSISMQSLYAKKQYKRIIKRLIEDHGTIWYDNLELEAQDFKFIRELYRTMFTHGN